MIRNLKKIFRIVPERISLMCISKLHFDIALIVFSIFLGVYLNWSLIYIIFFALLIWQILQPLSRITLAWASIILVALLPVAYYLNRQNDVEKISILTYVFLIFTCIMILVEKAKKVGSK